MSNDAVSTTMRETGRMAQMSPMTFMCDLIFVSIVGVSQPTGLLLLSKRGFL